MWNSLTIIIMGEKSSGKTSLCQRYLKDRFDSHCTPTIGVDFLGNQSLRYLDTGGGSQYIGIVDTYIRRSLQIVVICIDSQSAIDEKSLRGFLDRVQKQNGSSPSIVLVLTKTDLLESVDLAEKIQTLETLKSRLNIPTAKIYSCSAKENKGIKELFSEMKAQNPEYQAPSELSSVQPQTSTQKKLAYCLSQLFCCACRPEEETSEALLLRSRKMPL